MFYQYQVVQIVENINPVIKAGMQGVVLEVWDDSYEVEFLDDEGFNYEYEGKYTFTLNAKQLIALDWDVRMFNSEQNVQVCDATAAKL